MEQGNYRELKDKLISMGFESKYYPDITQFEGGRKEIAYCKNRCEDAFLYRWTLRENEDGEIEADKLEVGRKEKWDIPSVNAGGVALGWLKETMGTMNWDLNYLDPATLVPANTSLYLFWNVSLELKKLEAMVSEESKEIFDRLVFNSWAFTPNESRIRNLPELHKRYATWVRADLKGDNVLGAHLLENLLWGRYIYAKNNGLLPTWFKVDLSKRNEEGFVQLVRVPGCEHFNIERAAQEAGVLEIKNPALTSEIVDLLSQGEGLPLSFKSGRFRERRVFYANPENNAVEIDMARSDALGLCSREERERLLNRPIEYQAPKNNEELGKGNEKERRQWVEQGPNKEGYRLGRRKK